MQNKLLVAILSLLPLTSANAASLSPLEELLNTKVTTVSKVEESAFEAAAAVYVITKDDIKRSGATTIPDILRLAPGVQVAQAGSGSWAVSVRGFNSQYSNKLLVLIDGRSVYSPISSGVYWDVQDTPIEDIKQIEIIKGPGATLWGANAVNGVINIITEEAINTQKGYASATLGNEEQSLTGRYGGKFKKNTNYRTYAKFVKHGNSQDLNGNSSNDDWSMWRGGFRFDNSISTDTMLTIQGDTYYGNENHNIVYPTTTSPYRTTVADDEGVTGSNVLASWERTFDNGSTTTVKSYVDYISRNLSYYNQQRLTYDLDLQYNFKELGRHHIVIGTGYRLATDDIENNYYLTYTPTQRNDNLFSAFIQDKINILTDKLSLTLGSKFEHNNYTGYETQPSARLAYTPNTNNTFWASVSKAVRVPNRNMDDINFLSAGTPSGFLRLVGNRDVLSEKLVAYEAGYRSKIRRNLSLDLTAYYNSYDRLASFKYLNALTIMAANENSGKTMGWEASTKWEVNRSWTLSANYTHINMDINTSGASFVTTTAKTPQNQFSLISYMNLPFNLQFNNFLYYNEKINNGTIPSYYRWDSNIKWKARDNLEITLAGQNLNDSWHPEFSGFTYSNQANVGRNVYLKLNYYF